MSYSHDLCKKLTELTTRRDGKCTTKKDNFLKHLPLKLQVILKEISICPTHEKFSIKVGDLLVNITYKESSTILCLAPNHNDYLEIEYANGSNIKLDASWSRFKMFESQCDETMLYSEIEKVLNDYQEENIAINNKLASCCCVL